MELDYEHHGSHLVFRRSVDKIRLLGLFGKLPFCGRSLEGGSLLQLQFATKAAYRSEPDQVHTLSGESMRLITVLDLPRSQGDLIIIIMKDIATGILAEINYYLYYNSPTIGMWTRVRNDGRLPIQLHLVQPTVLHNIGFNDEAHDQRRMYIHFRPDLARGSQCRHQPLDNHPCSIAGSLPIGIVEELDTGEAWYWHLGHPFLWDWRIAEQRPGCLSLWVNDHSPRQNGLRVELRPGSAFKTPPIAFGLVLGGSRRAWDALCTHWRQINGASSRLPVTYYG